MTTHIAALAPQELPAIEYNRVDEEQARHMQEATELPSNQENFDVSFLPVETPEQRRAAAEEWAEYLQMSGEVEARERGAVFVLGTRDQSPEALVKLLEDEDGQESHEFTTYALSKVVLKNRDAKSYDLLRDYYGDEA